MRALRRSWRASSSARSRSSSCRSSSSASGISLNRPVNPSFYTLRRERFVCPDRVKKRAQQTREFASLFDVSALYDIPKQSLDVFRLRLQPPLKLGRGLWRSSRLEDFVNVHGTISKASGKQYWSRAPVASTAGSVSASARARRRPNECHSSSFHAGHAGSIVVSVFGHASNSSVQLVATRPSPTRTLEQPRGLHERCLERLTFCIGCPQLPRQSTGVQTKNGRKHPEQRGERACPEGRRHGYCASGELLARPTFRLAALMT